MQNISDPHYNLALAQSFSKLDFTKYTFSDSYLFNKDMINFQHELDTNNNEQDQQT